MTDFHMRPVDVVEEKRPSIETNIFIRIEDRFQKFALSAGSQFRWVFPYEFFKTVLKPAHGELIVLTLSLLCVLIIAICFEVVLQVKGQDILNIPRKGNKVDVLFDLLLAVVKEFNLLLIAFLTTCITTWLLGLLPDTSHVYSLLIGSLIGGSIMYICKYTILPPIRENQ